MDVRGLLADWLRRLDQGKMPLDRSIAETWLELLAEASPPSRDELWGLVALHARNHGESGRLASTLVRQLRSLEACFEAKHLDPSEVRALVPVAVDAHVIGVISRLERRQLRHLRELVPVLELPNRILACPVGPLPAELLDAVLGRAFALAAGTGSPEVALELSGVERLDDELILETLAAFPQHELASKIRIVVSGLEEPEKLEQQLMARKTGPTHVRCVRRLVDA